MRAILCFPGCHRRAGVERVMFECARHLAHQGHDVNVLADEWETIEHEKITYTRVSPGDKPVPGPKFFDLASEKLKTLDYDALNTHGVISPVDGVMWVQSIHAAWLTAAKKLYAPLTWRSIKQRINPAHSKILELEEKHYRERRYQRLIVTTEQVAKDLADFYDVPRDDIDVIPNGFSPSDFSPQRRSEKRHAMRDSLGIVEDEYVLLFVGHELDRKGFAVITEALKQMPERGRKVRVLAVGRFSRRRATKLAEKSGVADRIIMPGPTGTIADYHAAADLFVLPTQYEAFCLAILESLGSGLPVLTTAVPGAHDAIEHDQNGAIIQDPLDHDAFSQSLDRLLDRDVLDRMSNKAAELSIPYRWDHILPRFEQVMQLYADAG